MITTLEMSGRHRVKLHALSKEVIVSHRATAFKKGGGSLSSADGVANGASRPEEADVSTSCNTCAGVSDTSDWFLVSNGGRGPSRTTLIPDQILKCFRVNKRRDGGVRLDTCGGRVQIIKQTPTFLQACLS